MSDFLALVVQGILMGAEMLVHLDGPQRNFAALKWDERALIDEEAPMSHVTAVDLRANHNQRSLLPALKLSLRANEANT